MARRTWTKLIFGSSWVPRPKLEAEHVRSALRRTRNRIDADPREYLNVDLMPTITITGERSIVDETFAAEDGETVLSAAQRAAVPFAYSCQAGNCGSCKCELVTGEVFELDHSEFALSAAERANQWILACRTQVWGDTTIRRLSDDELVIHPSRVLQCRVNAIDELTHDIRGVRLQIESGGPFAFSAGQYASVAFTPTLARPYSMANTPDEPTLEFHVRRMPLGKASHYVFDHLKVGDALRVCGPLGSSYLRAEHAGPMLLIAGGTGLAPLQSILRARLQSTHTAPISLYFGVRSEQDLYNETLLHELARRHAHFRYEIVLSEIAALAGVDHRRHSWVHAAMEADFGQLAGYKAYVAGPPVMVEAASIALQSKGLANRDIHADAYYDQPQ